MIEELEFILRESVEKLINEEFKRMKTETLGTVRKHLSFSEKRSKLQILSAAEELEAHKIYDSAENIGLDRQHWRKIININN